MRSNLIRRDGASTGPSSPGEARSAETSGTQGVWPAARKIGWVPEIAAARRPGMTVQGVEGRALHRTTTVDVRWGGEVLPTLAAQRGKV